MKKVIIGMFAILLGCFVLIAQQTFSGNFLISGNFTVTSSSAPTIFYVDNTQSDANNGLTQATAWQHIQYAATNSIVAAAALAGPVQVLLNSSEVFQEQCPIVDTNCGLSSNAPLVFSSYGGGMAVVSNTPTALTATGILQVKANNITISNLYFEGNTNWVTNLLSGFPGNAYPFGPYDAGVAIISPGGITWSNITVDSCVLSGLSFGVLLYTSNDAAGVLNTVVSRNVITNIGITGIEQMGQQDGTYNVFGGTSLISNKISYVYGIPNQTSGDGVAFTQGTNIVVANNVIHDCGIGCDTTGGGAQGIIPYKSQGYILVSNEVYRQYANASAADGQGIDCGSYNCAEGLVEYNYSHHNQGGGFYTDNAYSNIVIRYNVSEADDQLGLTAFEDAEFASSSTVFGGGLQVYGNLFLGTFGAEAVNINQGLSGTNWFANNILFSSKTNLVHMVGGNVSFNGNDYFTTATAGPWFKSNTTVYSSLSSWQSSWAGYDNANAKSADPYFVMGWQYVTANMIPGNGSPNTLTNWILAAGSPLISAGVNVASLYSVNPGTQDFMGNALTTSPNIGAVNINGTAGYTNILRGLVAWWQVQEGAGAWGEYTGNGNFPTASGSPIWQNDGTRVYQTFVAASSMHETLPANSTLTTVPFTVSCWCRVTNVATKQQFIFSAGAANGPAWGINPTPATLELFKENVGGLGSVSTANVPESVATWHNIAVSYDGVNLAFYIDGAAEGTSTSTSTTFTATTIGLMYDRFGAASYWNGDVRLISWYNRVLTSGEVANIYNLGLIANESGIVGQ